MLSLTGAYFLAHSTLLCACWLRQEMASRVFRNIWPYLRGFSQTRISPVVIYIRNNRILSFTTILGISGCALIGYKLNLNRLIRPFPNLVAGEQVDKSKQKVSRREKRYMEFSSKMYHEEIYMTPRDFMESLIKDEARCEWFTV